MFREAHFIIESTKAMIASSQQLLDGQLKQGNDSRSGEHGIAKGLSAERH
jgi:hypothetical protein